MITESQFYFTNISATKARIFMKFFVVVYYYLVSLSVEFHDNLRINACTERPCRNYCEPVNMAETEVHTHKDSTPVNVRNKKKKISWIGTSLSKAQNKNKFEQDLNVDLSVSRAYCIKEGEKAKYKKENFEEIVPKVIVKEEPDILVLQTGSIEITNIEVNEALMDQDSSLVEYKKIWFDKVEQDSKNLFEIAQAALKNRNSLDKVVILKRLPRHGRSSSDFFSIKSEL